MADAGDDADRSWLEMLVDGAPLADLEHRRARLVANGPAHRRAHVESEARQALHLHTLLAERKRHTAELAALNDLARQLTSLRDPKEVLTEVAVQTRRLLGADVAYIMLASDDDVLRIEVVDGSLGSALRGIELSRGYGLGGWVLKTGRPYWSADYVHDASLRHTKSVDAAAQIERLGGILGVPLRVGSLTIGVLLAADREPRSFSDHEVGLLTSLAAHAAVAIHNAEMFDQYQRAAEAIQRTVDLHERLTNTVLSGGGLNDVVEALGSVLDVPVAVLDANDEPVAASTGQASAGLAGDALDAGSPAKSFACPADRRTRTGRGSSNGSWAVTPIVVADEYAGCVTVRREQEFDDGAIRLLETGATVIGLVLASDRAVAEAERRVQGEFVAELLAGHADDKTMHRRAASAGVNVGAIRCVVVLDPASADVSTALAIGSRLARDRDGWSAHYDRRIVAFLPAGDPASVREQLQAIGGDSQVTAAIARTSGAVADVRAAYRRARDAVMLLLALGRSGARALADELAVYQLLFTPAGQDGLRRFIDTTIGPLLRHDEEHGADLAATLEAYLAQTCRHAATAEILHIHVNTLYQRLARISDVLGEDWRSPDRALETQLALRLHRLSESLPAPGEH